MANKSILPIQQLSKESVSLYEALNEGNGVTAVLVAAGFLDACLGSLLETQLIESRVTEKILYSPSGTLNSYSSRADVCYALGLLPKVMYMDLIKIAEIRNKFAHSHMEIHFDNEVVSKLCNELKYVESLKNGNTDEPLIQPGIVKYPRDKFVIAAVMINNKLLLKGLELERQRMST